MLLLRVVAVVPTQLQLQQRRCLDLLLWSRELLMHPHRQLQSGLKTRPALQSHRQIILLLALQSCRMPTHML